MKKIIILSTLVIFSLLSFQITNAISGACASHGGVNCNASQINGKVVCNDGWTDSTADYNSMIMCGGATNLNEVNFIQTIENDKVSLEKWGTKEEEYSMQILLIEESIKNVVGTGGSTGRWEDCSFGLYRWKSVDVYNSYAKQYGMETIPTYSNNSEVFCNNTIFGSALIPFWDEQNSLAYNIINDWRLQGITPFDVVGYWGKQGNYPGVYKANSEERIILELKEKTRITHIVKKESVEKTSSSYIPVAQREGFLDNVVLPKQEVTLPVNPEPAKKLKWYQKIFSWFKKK